MAEQGSQSGTGTVKDDKSLHPGDSPSGPTAPRSTEATAPSGSGVEPGTVDKPDKKV